jgi:cytochrome oxidase assembly protein ShyY1
MLRIAMNQVRDSAKKPLGRRKVWVGLVLLALTVAATISLGRWQLSRAQEKRDLLAQVEAGRRQPPLHLAADTAEAELQAWRPAVASGRWLADRTVLLDNRSAGGRPGFWVVTPLLLDGPSPQTSVAVLRGWLPREFPDVPLKQVPTPDGLVSVSGELVSHVPRLMELTSFSGPRQGALPEKLPTVSGVLPRLQNLELAAYAEAAGIKVLPALLQQGSTNDGWVRDWPAPPSNIEMHRGYALQWFSFAAIAAIAFGVLLVQYLRSSRR